MVIIKLESIGFKDVICIVKVDLKTQFLVEVCKRKWLESKQKEISMLQSEVLYASLLRRDRADFGVLCIPPEKVYSTLRRLSLIVILSKLIAGFE